jgi:hypothetical protein
MYWRRGVGNWEEYVCAKFPFIISGPPFLLPRVTMIIRVINNNTNNGN